MNNKHGLHTHVEDFEVEDGCLCIGGRKLTSIVKEIGPTPSYIYDKKLIHRRISSLKEILPDAVSLHYAIKANPMPAVVEFVAKLVDGLDIASVGELEVALQSGCDPSEMSFAGPGKQENELEAAIRSGITINAESPTEIERIGRIAGDTRIRPRVAIRVNPDFELKNSGMRMSGGPKQFGIDAELVGDVMKRFGQLPIDFAGFHIFSGAQNLRQEAICESQQKSFQLALDLSKLAPAPPGFINIGGGFGIPYFPGDTPLELAPIASNLELIANRLQKVYPDCELVLELGRYLVGEAGIYVCSVTDKKVSRGHTFLITNGGLHHHLSATGNFGQVIRKNYPVVIANRMNDHETESVSVVGPLCTPLDALAVNMELPKAEIGDLVVVFQSGAYGYTASPHRFLSHPPPRELLV